MIIKQFRYHSDNLAYVIHGTSHAIAIDGGAVSDILAYLKKNQLTLKYIVNTHNHADHTSGNKRLLQATDASLIPVKQLISNKNIQIEHMDIKIYETPGHTQDSICFHFNDFLVTGDTLFNGTVGNCFTNDETTFVKSLKKILTLPDHTIVYPGHDYVLPAMQFAKKHSLNINAVNTFLATYNPKHICSDLAQEKSHNIFFRLDSPEIIKLLQSKGLPISNEFQLFRSLKKIEIWE